MVNMYGIVIGWDFLNVDNEKIIKIMKYDLKGYYFISYKENKTVINNIIDKFSDELENSYDDDRLDILEKYLKKYGINYIGANVRRYSDYIGCYIDNYVSYDKIKETYRRLSVNIGAVSISKVLGKPVIIAIKN